MLRIATKDDFEDILRMARAFHEASPYKKTQFSERQCEAIFKKFLQKDQTELVIILACDPEPFGMIIGVRGSLPFSEDVACTELAWWVDVEKRGHKDSLRLVRAYEDWAKRVGADLTQLAMLDDLTDLTPFYNRMGFQRSEQSFIKYKGD